MVQTNFLVKKRKISQLDSVPLTGEYNIDTFHFDFDEEWKGLDKTLVLISGGQRYNIALLNDSALMPFETYQIKGDVQIGLFGTDNGYRTLATGWLPLYIEEDSYEVNTEPENLPSPTQWDLYVTEINGLLTQCRATKEDCEEILNQMQLDYEQYLQELNQIKSDTEDIKEDTQTIYNATNQIKTDVQGLKRQIEEDIADANLRIDEYNQNAQQKTNAFNQNYNDKIGLFNQNVTDKTNTFNQNVTDKTTSFNNNAISKTNDFNSNVASKTNTFNQNAQDKLDEVTGAGTTAVGNIQDAEDTAISHIQEEGASYDVRLDNLENVTGTGTNTFNTSSTYEVGDVVVYENKLYRCITAIETAGAWDSTKWQEINLRQEQDEQNGKIEQLETDVDLLASNYDPKEVTIEGTGTITDAINWYGESVPIGNTEQNTTSISGGDEYDSPSPTHPQTIHNVSGDVSVESSNSDSTLSQSITFPLSEGQKMYEGDYLADDGIHHVKKQIVLTGNENIGWDNTQQTRFRIAISPYCKMAGSCNSNYFSSVRADSLCLVTPSNTYVSLWLWDRDFYFEQSIDNLKSFLAEKYASNTPVIVEYELRNEIIDPYTEAQQKAWEKLKKMRTYKGTTHIMASSDDLAPDLKVTYLQNPLSSIEARLELLES